MPRSDDQLPLTVAQLAAESGLSETTLRNWSKRRTLPLERVQGPRQMHTWAQLFRFIDSHPTLYKAPAIARLRTTPPSRPSASGPPRTRTQVAALQAAAAAHLNAIVEALRAAEAAAHLHREQIETLMNALDEVAQTATTTPAGRR